MQLSDLGTIITGKTPTTKNEQYWNGNIPFVTPGDIQGTKHIWETARYVTEEGMKSVKGAIIPANAICVSCIGNIGYVGVTTRECISNQQINSIIVSNDHNHDYVFYLLKSLWPFFKHYEGQSTTLSILNKTQFSQIEIPDIKREDEDRIAKVLNSLDDKIELNIAMNDVLLQQAQTLYKSWFVDYVPFNGTRPTDWIMGTIDDLAKEIVCGKTPSTKIKEYYGSDIPFITIPDMHRNAYVVTTERYLSTYGANSQPKKTLPKNSVCVSCIGTAGLVTLVASESQTNQQINSIIPKDNYSPFYIYLLMQTLSEVINKLGQSGSTIVNLNKAQFGKINVMIPSVSTMKDFDELVSPLFKLMLENQKENIQVSSMRDVILPKLMSGELDVSDIKL